MRTYTHKRHTGISPLVIGILLFVVGGFFLIGQNRLLSLANRTIAVVTSGNVHAWHQGVAHDPSPCHVYGDCNNGGDDDSTPPPPACGLQCGRGYVCATGLVCDIPRNLCKIPACVGKACTCFVPPTITPTRTPTRIPTITPTPTRVPSLTPTPPICVDQKAEIIIAIDRTNSMVNKDVGGLEADGRTKLAWSKEAAQSLITEIAGSPGGQNGSVRIGIVSFGGSDAGTRTHQALTGNLTTLGAIINQINYDSLDGWTCVSCGLKAANTALTAARPDASKNVIIITDGEANRMFDGAKPSDYGSGFSVLSAQQAIDQATAGKAVGTKYYVLGYGTNARTNVLMAIANDPDTIFYRHRTRPEDWAAIFTAFGEIICSNRPTPTPPVSSIPVTYAISASCRLDAKVRMNGVQPENVSYELIAYKPRTSTRVSRTVSTRVDIDTIYFGNWSPAMKAGKYDYVLRKVGSTTDIVKFSNKTYNPPSARKCRDGGGSGGPTTPR